MTTPSFTDVLWEPKKKIVGLEKNYFLNEETQMASKTSEKRHKKRSRKHTEPSVYHKFLAEHKDATRKRVLANMYPGRSLTSLTQEQWLKLNAKVMSENAKLYRQKYPNGSRKTSVSMTASKSKKRKGSKRRSSKSTSLFDTAMFSEGYKVSKKSASKVSKKSASKVSKKSASKVSKKSSKSVDKTASKRKYKKRAEAYATKVAQKSVSKTASKRKHKKRTEAYATKVGQKSVSKTASKKRRKHTEAYSADKSGAKKMSLGYLLRYF